MKGNPSGIKASKLILDAMFLSSKGKYEESAETYREAALLEETLLREDKLNPRASRAIALSAALCYAKAGERSKAIETVQLFYGKRSMPKSYR